MVNDVFVDDDKIKTILKFISQMKHSEQIRMMLFCSLNGMRSINFRNLQLRDVYTPDHQVKDAICLDNEKNKGKFKCSYILNTQIKKEFADYLKYLQSTRYKLDENSYLFVSQKNNKPYNRLSITRIFKNIYEQFNIHGGSHLGRHLFVSKLVNSGVNIGIVQRLTNHRHLSSTQKYFNCNEDMLLKAVENVRI